ncbi:hypothetical protein ASD00_22605 [Ensifer sp. Root31]|nr:hypothetical protein ASD00_22605 [Ensifer sp. Root31]
MRATVALARHLKELVAPGRRQRPCGVMNLGHPCQALKHVRPLMRGMLNVCCRNAKVGRTGPRQSVG